MTTLKDIEDLQTQLRNGKTDYTVNTSFMKCLGWERRLTARGERLARNGHPSLISDPLHTDWFDKDGVRKININPTTNTDDALLEVPEDFLHADIVYSNEGCGVSLWLAPLGRGIVSFDGQAPTLPAAICIAILEYYKEMNE